MTFLASAFKVVCAAAGVAALSTAGLSAITQLVARSRTSTAELAPRHEVGIVLGAQVYPGGEPSLKCRS